MKRIVLLLLVAGILFSFSSCVGKSAQKSGITTSDVNSNPYKFDMNGNPITTEAFAESINDTTKFDKDLFAKRVYELKTFFGAENFLDPSKISISAVVLYSFHHIYYPSLLTMPKGKLLYRQTSVEIMNEEIKKNFNLSSFDATQSDLYSANKNTFEMWQQNYSGTPVYTAETKTLGTDKYELTVTFFANNDTAKKTPLSRSVAVIEKSGGNYVFSSLSSANL